MSHRSLPFSVRIWGNSTLLRPNESTERHIGTVHRTRDVVMAVFFFCVFYITFSLSGVGLRWLFIRGDHTHEVCFFFLIFYLYY